MVLLSSLLQPSRIQKRFKRKIGEREGREISQGKLAVNWAGFLIKSNKYFVNIKDKVKFDNVILLSLEYFINIFTL